MRPRHSPTWATGIGLRARSDDAPDAFVARRCIDGVDLNCIAVELADSPWGIHTLRARAAPVPSHHQPPVVATASPASALLDEALESDPDTIHETVSIFRREIRRPTDVCKTFKRLAILADATVE
ncbi:MAG: hypothetical protein M5U31_00330 [Acidimicrobiia bacterium]|nr:hypothetical protein [Acidimicrobiia bacterium]